MSIRDWAIKQLRKDSRTAVPVGSYGITVNRRGRTDASAYFVEPDDVKPFTADDLQSAANEFPQARMVIVTRRVIDPGVYERARELGICVDTFGGFNRALDECDDISEYIHPEEKYIRNRIAATRSVISITRWGHRAWELRRANKLRPLMIVTHDRYELTDDGFTEIINQYPELELDALVITNPSARGFGKRVVESAKRSGVPLYTLNQFLAKIREPWT